MGSARGDPHRARVPDNPRKLLHEHPPDATSLIGDSAKTGAAAVGVYFDHFHSDYDEALARGLVVSGEGRGYFARGRITHLGRRFATLGASRESVLDFGCGTGASAPEFLEVFGARRVLGVDVSVRSLRVAQQQHGSDRVEFLQLSDFEPRAEHDVAFCNGVFHHVPPPDRAAVARLLYEAVRPGGHLALWENNPWNPGARYVMSRIPFDRDAVMLSSRMARRIVEEAGFEVLGTDYLFVFPRALQRLRFLEPRLEHLPLGAQYLVLARKPL